MTLIAQLVKDVLSTPMQQLIWSERLGLVYCAFVIPTDLFITPIKCLIPANTWDLNQTPDYYLSGPTFDFSTSFFDTNVLSSGIVTVAFLHDRPLTTYPSPRDESTPDAIVVDDPFLEYLDEWNEQDTYSLFSESDPSKVDPRLRTFAWRNYRALGRLFPVFGSVFSLSTHSFWHCLSFVPSLNSAATATDIAISCSGMNHNLFPACSVLS